MSSNAWSRGYIRVLEEELIPAMGCTEPIAVAYAAAVCCQTLGELPDTVHVMPSGNIIKNAKSVIVPGTGGQRGIEAAAAAGIIAGQPEKHLEVISGISDEQREQIADLLQRNMIHVAPLDTEKALDVVVEMFSSGHSAKVHLCGTHTNIVSVVKDGRLLAEGKDTDAGSTLSDRAFMNVRDIYEFAETADAEDIRAIVQPQIRLNYLIAKEGLAGNHGAGIGKMLYEAAAKTDPYSRAIAAAAAGADARMAGCEMPVIINSGSGNQGITVSVPVVVFGREKGFSEDAILRAVVLSNLLSIYQKLFIGRLSAYCGAVNAGAAAMAAIAYLQEHSYTAVIHTLVNALAISSGIICDGAKPSCAAKIAVSLQSGYIGLMMYQNGQEFYGGDGIISKGVEATISNVGRLGHDGMKETDKEILRIMTGC